MLLPSPTSVVTNCAKCYHKEGEVFSDKKRSRCHYEVRQVVLHRVTSIITKCDNCSTDCDKCHNKVWQFSKKAQRLFRTDFKNRILSHCSRILGKLYRRGSVGGSGQQRRRGEGEGMHNTKEVSISGRLYDR